MFSHVIPLPINWSGHWLVVHCECMLWCSGSTLLSTSPWKEQQPETTRANSGHETDTDLSYCGNLNLSPGKRDFFLLWRNSWYAMKREGLLAFLPVFLFISKLAVRTYFPGGAHFYSWARNNNELDLLFQANEHTWNQQGAVINQVV